MIAAKIKDKKASEIKMLTTALIETVVKIKSKRGWRKKERDIVKKEN